MDCAIPHTAIYAGQELWHFIFCQGEFVSVQAKMTCIFQIFYLYYGDDTVLQLPESLKTMQMGNKGLISYYMKKMLSQAPYSQVSVHLKFAYLWVNGSKLTIRAFYIAV